MITFEKARMIIAEAKEWGHTSFEVPDSSLLTNLNYYSENKKSEPAKEKYIMNGDIHFFVYYDEDDSSYKMWFQMGSKEDLMVFLKAFRSFGIDIIPDDQKEAGILCWDEENKHRERKDIKIFSWNEIFTDKEMAELNKVHSNENEPVPVDFIDAMKIIANLNRAINTLALIGFNIEGSSDNAFGSCIWSALTNAENIIFRNMSYNPSNEVIENTIQDFINRQTYNAITEGLIKCFYRTYSTKCCSMEFYDSMRKKSEAHHFDNLSSEEINKTCGNTENKSKFVAYEIDWDIGIEDIYNLLDDMECREAAEFLGISIDEYANMSVTDRHDYAYDDFHHNRLDWEPYFNLPDEVEIPDEFEITSTDDDMQYVTDWLSDTYGFCIKGYKVKSK